MIFIAAFLLALFIASVAVALFATYGPFALIPLGIAAIYGYLRYRWGEESGPWL
jgi:hypothetical protein